MALHKGLPIRGFASRSAFEVWLGKNHAKNEAGVWVKFAKKGSGKASVTYVEAREVAIIYGWIDGLKNTIDETYYALRFTPRRPRSKWSKINREIAEGLIKSRKMKPAGKRQVEAARADGRWEMAYAGQATMEIPADFKRALAKTPAAKKTFATISAANRYAILHSIHDAKRSETRARRITKYVAMLAKGDVLQSEPLARPADGRPTSKDRKFVGRGVPGRLGAGVARVGTGGFWGRLGRVGLAGDGDL